MIHAIGVFRRHERVGWNIDSTTLMQSEGEIFTVPEHARGRNVSQRRARYLVRPNGIQAVEIGWASSFFFNIYEVSLWHVTFYLCIMTFTSGAATLNPERTRTHPW